MHIAIPTPSSSFDESATLRPSQCIGKSLARTIVQRGCFESESEISKVTQEFLDRCIVRSNPLKIGDCSATKDRSRNPRCLARGVMVHVERLARRWDIDFGS